MPIGLVSFGLHLPTERESADQLTALTGLDKAELAELGIAARPRPGPVDQPVPMAAAAARQALERAGGMDPDQVDLVIWTGEEYKDYVAQTASIRLQEEVGCRRAWAFDLVGQGVTLLLGLRMARDAMIGDASIRTVLLAGGTRHRDLVDQRNPDTRFLLPYAASGAAMIIGRDHPANQLMAVDIGTDPDMADEVMVLGGGTERPFAADNLDSPDMFFQVRRPAEFHDYWTRVFPARLAGQIGRCLKGARPDYLALRHLPPAARSLVLGELGLDPARSLPLDEWGHHGANDVVISLELGLRLGLVRQGRLVALASAGIGFTYAAALLRWGTAGE